MTPSRRIFGRAGLVLTMSLVAAVAGSSASAVASTTYTCAGKLATIVGTDGPDVIQGTAGDDVIVGLRGNDTIYSNGGNDTICGDEGNDSLVPNENSGTLLLYGGPGGDTLNSGPGRNSLLGGPGRDALYAFDQIDGNSVVNGGSGEDYCTADPGDIVRNCP